MRRLENMATVKEQMTKANAMRRATQLKGLAMMRERLCRQIADSPELLKKDDFARCVGDLVHVSESAYWQGIEAEADALQPEFLER